MDPEDYFPCPSYLAWFISFLMKPKEDSQRMPTIYSRSTIGENTNGRTNFPTFHILHLVEHFYLIPFDPSSFMTDYFYILNILIVSLYRYNLHIISASSPLYSCLVHLPNIRWSSQLLDRQLASVIWQQTCSLLTSLAINRSFIRSQCHFFFIWSLPVLYSTKPYIISSTHN